MLIKINEVVRKKVDFANSAPPINRLIGMMRINVVLMILNSSIKPLPYLPEFSKTSTIASPSKIIFDTNPTCSICNLLETVLVTIINRKQPMYIKNLIFAL